MNNNLAQKTVGHFINPPETMVDQMKTGIESLVPRALAVCKEYLERDDVSIDQKFKVAKYILDISSVGSDSAKAQSPHIVTTMVQNYSPQELVRLRAAADRIIASLKKNGTPSK